MLSSPKALVKFRQNWTQSKDKLCHMTIEMRMPSHDVKYIATVNCEKYSLNPTVQKARKDRSSFPINKILSWFYSTTKSLLLGTTNSHPKGLIFESVSGYVGIISDQNSFVAIHSSIPWGQTL